jgi:DNA-binding CsgD family transcriptional regulator
VHNRDMVASLTSELSTETKHSTVRYSGRQRTIIEMASDGKTDKEIAHVTGLAEGTLRTYWDRLRRKLKATSRTEVIAIFWKNEHLRLQRNADVDRPDESRLDRERELLSEILQGAEFATWTWDIVADKVYLNSLAKPGSGIEPDESPSTLRSFLAGLHRDDLAAFSGALEASLRAKGSFRIEYRLLPSGRSEQWMMARGRVSLDPLGNPAALTCVLVDISEHKRTERFLEGHRRIMEMILRRAPALAVLEALMLMVEANSTTKIRASLLLLEGVQLRKCASPNIPEEYSDAIDGVEVGSSFGPCATAAFTRMPIFVADIALDRRWPEFSKLALSYGFRASWSIPVFGKGGEVLGTFAMYYEEPRKPCDEDLRCVGLITETAALAIEQLRVQAAEVKGLSARAVSALAGN